jgi:hypothetical protein
MRTTIELPDELLGQAKSQAALSGISLREFFVEAVEQKLRPVNSKKRKDPPALGGSLGPRLGILTPEQLDEAMFG